jgi:hypothetical protein
MRTIFKERKSPITKVLDGAATLLRVAVHRRGTAELKSERPVICT